MAKTDQRDRWFYATTTFGASLVFVLLAAIVIFLVVQATPALRESGASFLTEREWFPDAQPAQFGVLALVFGTIVSSAVALLIAMPVAIGSALFVVEIAPRAVGKWIGYLVDLLAAVPSVVYGLWGVVFLVPHLAGVEQAIDAVLGWIPIFDNRTGTYGRSLFAAAVVLAIMILPIISALTREIFVQVPRSHREAAMALGATRWEVIRLAVLPYGRSGVFGAAMLGLGRALGETIAVALVLAASFKVNIHIFEPGGNTIAANIATKFPEASDIGRSALIASGLVLFIITLVVNAFGRYVVARNKIKVKAAR